MTPSVHSVEWGGRTIEFALVYAARKRVAIEVNPDQSVLVRAPVHAGIEPVLGIVRRKAKWVLRQQRFFETFRPRTPERQFVSGESHNYLGRKYRLKVHAADNEERVRLHGGYLHVYSSNPADAGLKRQLLEAWYRGHAERVFPARVAACMDHRLFRRLATPKLQIRKLQSRWGSFTPAGKILLNVDLIRAPRICIDYVITHELCHILVPDHSREFQRLLIKAMPDWEERKARLEATLA